jgi:predicted transcriptional regulator
MANINKLKGKIVENGLTVEKIAISIGVDKSTFYRKMKNEGKTFTIREAGIIARELSLTPDEVNAIFFTHTVAFGATNEEVR